MKKILFVSIISIFISQMAIAQDSLIKFEKIVNLDSTYSKDDIYSKARQWISDNFKDANAVITIEDKERGELSGNANIRILPSSKIFTNVEKQIVKFKCSILIKEGKYKCSFYSFDHECLDYYEYSLGLLSSSEKFPYKNAKGMYGKILNHNWVEAKAQVNSNIELLYNSLEKAMREKSKNEDW